MEVADLSSLVLGIAGRRKVTNSGPESWPEDHSGANWGTYTGWEDGTRSCTVSCVFPGLLRLGFLCLCLTDLEFLISYLHLFSAPSLNEWGREPDCLNLLAAVLISESFLSCLLLTLAEPSLFHVKGMTFHSSSICHQSHRCRGPSLPEPSLVSDWLLTAWCNFRLKMWYWNQRKLTHSWFELQWLELWHYVSSNGCCVWVSESAALVQISFDVNSYVLGDSIVNVGIMWCVSKPFFFKFLFVWFGEMKFHSVALRMSWIHSNLPASGSQMLGFICLFILILFYFMCVWFFFCLFEVFGFVRQGLIR